MAGRQTSTFDLAKIQRTLGIKSLNANPDFSSDVQLVAQVAEFSQSFANEQFDSRAFGSVEVISTAVSQAVAQLISLSPGGIVIERIDVTAGITAGGPTPIAEMKIVPPQVLTLTIPIAVVRTLEVGGEPIKSTLEGGVRPPETGAQIALDVFGQKTFENFGWFVPSGSAFQLMVPVLNEVLVNFQWREIPQAPGSV